MREWTMERVEKVNKYMGMSLLNDGGVDWLISEHHRLTAALAEKEKECEVLKSRNNSLQLLKDESECSHANDDGSCCGSCADLAQSYEDIVPPDEQGTP